ncbi:unnamed protein product [Prunus armeniaca]
MTAYLQHTRHLLTTFNAYLIGQVPRSENNHADALARLASAMEQGIGRNIHIEFLDQPSTRAPLIYAIDHNPTWMDPIVGANFAPLEYSPKIPSSSPLLFLPAKQIGVKGPHPGGAGQRPSDAYVR